MVKRKKLLWFVLFSSKFAKINSSLYRSMQGQIKLTAFGFNESFQLYQTNDLINAFFRDPIVVGTLNQLLPFWAFDKDAIQKIDVETVPCTKISMEFFDRLLDPKNGVVRGNGNLQHCVDDYRDEFIISDELRKVSFKLFIF